MCANSACRPSISSWVPTAQIEGGRGHREYRPGGHRLTSGGQQSHLGGLARGCWALPVVHVLYLFAGVKRNADVRDNLVELAKRDNFCLKGLQLDILRNEGYDLHRDDVWRWVSQQLQSGVVELFLVAPPCNTHSRVRCQYRQYGGPRTLRDFNLPYGYPWLSNDNKQNVQAEVFSRLYPHQRS